MPESRLRSRRRVRLQRWIVVLLAAAAGSKGVPAACAARSVPACPRVAMMDFTSDDGLVRSAEGAAQWSALVQDAVAAQEPALDWVERAQMHLAADELHLSAAGFMSVEGSLHVGKWLRADVAILGRFTRNAQNGDGHTLRLEVVGLDRGDNLAVRTIHLDGDRRAAIVPDPSSVQSTVEALRGALTEAQDERARAVGQKVVAPLFFQNADASPRLDHFGSDLLEGFTEAAAAAHDVRVLRFPQASQAWGEAELAVAGLSEHDEDAWRHVADLYVWGSYRERPAAEAAFAQTPVEVALTLWDGVHPPQQIEAEATVAQLPAVARRLAGQCLDAARLVPAVRPAAGEARGEIGRILREQGRRLEAATAGRGADRGAYLDTPEGKARLTQWRLLSEVACFFLPADPDAQLARLRARWTDFPSPIQRLPLLDLWRRSNDLADYARRCGSLDPGLARSNVEADAYLLQRLYDGEEALHVSGGESILPVDAGGADLARWHAALDARFACDALAYLKGTARDSGQNEEAHPFVYAAWMQAALRWMQNPSLAADVAEAVWPRYRTFYQRNSAREDPRYGLRGGGLTAAVQALYTRLGQPERAGIILEAGSVGGVATDALPARPAVAAARPMPAVLLPHLEPTFRTLRLPKPAASSSGERRDPRYVVHNLVVGSGGLLWVSAFHDGDNGGRFNHDQPQDVWTFDPVDDVLARLPLDGLTQRTPITSLLPQAECLWLTVGMNGVWRYDLARAQVTRRYTVADGLLTADLDAGLAAPGGGLYFGGHENGRPLLNRFDPAGQGWLRVVLPDSAVDVPDRTADDGKGFPWVPSNTQVVAFQRWLIVRLGGSWTLLDTRSGQSRSLREALPAPLGNRVASRAETVPVPGTTVDQLPLPGPRPCTADARGFWLAVDGKIIRFDPARPGEARSWPLPEQLADGVTALAADGENLWLAGPAGFSRPGYHGHGFIAVLDEVDGRWLGSFELPSPVGCLAAGRQVIYADQQTDAQPLVEIDKEATLRSRAR